MKESMWGYYLILLGIMVSTVMILMSNMVTTNQQDYYLLKEVTNASMHDSVDWSYYKKYGEMRINTEKFVEVFVRRFSESVSKTNTYKIDVYSVYENPPSVSIRVTSNTGDFHIAGDATNVDVINSYDAILESNNNIFSDNCTGDGCSNDSAFVFYSLPYETCTSENQYIKEYDKDGKVVEENSYCKIANKVPLALSEESDVIKIIKEKVNKYYETMGESKRFDINRVKISDVHFLNIMNSKNDIEKYKSNFTNVYNYIPNTSDILEVWNSSLGYDNSNYLAKNVKNVRISVVDGDNNKKYLAFGLDFNCIGVKTYGDNDGVSQYRAKYTGNDYRNSKQKYITSEYYNSLSEEQKKSYEWTPYYNACLVGIKYKIDFYYDYD